MFPGTHAIERALEAYHSGQIEHTGVMVHLVPDEGVDSGPVLNQRVVSILPEDTVETLEARMHKVEHTLLMRNLKTLFENPFKENTMPKALLSVFDKTGLVELLAGLASLGWS